MNDNVNLDNNLLYFQNTEINFQIKENIQKSRELLSSIA